MIQAADNSLIINRTEVTKGRSGWGGKHTSLQIVANKQTDKHAAEVQQLRRRYAQKTCAFEHNHQFSVVEDFLTQTQRFSAVRNQV